MNRFDRYVGMPYAARGRGLQGADCWGLFCLVYRELLDIELPAHSDDYMTDADRAELAGLIAGDLPGWDAVTRGMEAPFDAVLMRVGREACHIGMVVAPMRLLHIEERLSSCIERYDAPRLAHRIVGFYRYVARPHGRRLVR